MSGLLCLENPEHALRMAEAWRDAIKTEDLDGQALYGPIVEDFVMRVEDIDRKALDERHRAALQIAGQIRADYEDWVLGLPAAARFKDDDIPF